MLVPAYSSWEVEAGGAEVQGHPQLHNKVEASLGYLKPCQGKEKENAIERGKERKVTGGEEKFVWKQTVSEYDAQRRKF